MVAVDGPSGKRERITDIAVECIVPNPRQPRRSFDEAALDALAESIRQHGVVQPSSSKSQGPVNMNSLPANGGCEPPGDAD